MTRRVATLAAITTTVLVLTVAAPVLAKEGGEAVLGAPIPRDAEPGTTVEVAWDAWVPDGDRRLPIFGSPLVLVVTGADGNLVEVAGAERPAGSGHYEGSFVVPPGGIVEVGLGLRGTMCDAGGCVTSDIPIAFVEPPLVGPAWVAPPVPEGPAPEPPAAAGPPTEPTPDALPVGVAALAVLAMVAALAGVLRTRRTRGAAGAATRA